MKVSKAQLLSDSGDFGGGARSAPTGSWGGQMGPPVASRGRRQRYEREGLYPQRFPPKAVHSPRPRGVAVGRGSQAGAEAARRAQRTLTTALRGGGSRGGRGGRLETVGPPHAAVPAAGKGTGALVAEDTVLRDTARRRGQVCRDDSQEVPGGAGSTEPGGGGGWWVPGRGRGVGLQIGTMRTSWRWWW